MRAQAPLRAAAAALAASALLLAGPLDAQVTGVDLPVRTVELDNGMRVLVLPRAGAPTISFVVQYQVGSVNERLGNTGIAHLLEHLLFKGTTTVGTRDPTAERHLFRRMDAAHDTLLALRATRRPDSAALRRLDRRVRLLEDSARAHVVPNELDRILTRRGARNLNATTSHEATTYYVELPANRLELWFVLEAERMHDPVFREFYSERDVVMEERRTRVETNPGGRLLERHLAHAFTVHPYGVPVIGHMSDLRNLTRAQAEEYHRKYYAARNAVVAIVGDVDPDQVESLARRYLGPLAPGEPPPPVLAVEPPQRGERRIDVEFDAEPQIRIGWRIPDVFHPDRPALDMLASLLAGGPTSRLHRRLVVEGRLAASVSAGLGPGERFPGLFQIGATPRAPHGAADVERAIDDELDRLRERPPEPAELERVRNQIEAGSVRRLQSNLGLAMQLARSVTLHGDWRTTFEFDRRLEAVTPEDVRRVARLYLRPTRRTVATLVPEEGRP